MNGSNRHETRPIATGPSFLGYGEKFHFRRSEEVSELYASLGHLANHASPTPLGFKGTTSIVEWKGGSLHYSELAGTLLSSISFRGHELSLGALLAGHATIFCNGDRFDVSPRDSLIAFPGDETIYLLEGTKSFTFRVPVAQELFFRLKALPHRVRLGLPRLLSADDSEDFIRLFQFAWSESDRQFELHRHRPVQVQVIGNAIVQRLGVMIDDFLGPIQSLDPEMVRICVVADAVLCEHNLRRVSAEQLAKTALCSVRQLYRAFEAVTGLSPNAYQLRCRLLDARAKIVAEATGKMTISAIASEQGFTSMSRFAGAYSLEFGETPSETRQNCIHQASVLIGIANGQMVKS